MLLIRCQNDFINAQHCNVLPAGQFQRYARPSWLQYNKVAVLRPQTVFCRSATACAVACTSQEEVKTKNRIQKIPEGTA